MKRIEIFEWRLNEKIDKYRGLYRGNSILSTLDQNDSIYLAYSKVSSDRNGVELTECIYRTIENIYYQLRKNGKQADLIVFSDELSFGLDNDSFAFIGYDICADSAYYSPIGDYLLDEIIEKGVLHNFVNSNDVHQIYLNENGLIDSYKSALCLANLCIDLQIYGKYEFEAEALWRPFKLWALGACTN